MTKPLHNILHLKPTPHKNEQWQSVNITKALIAIKCSKPALFRMFPFIGLQRRGPWAKLHTSASHLLSQAQDWNPSGSCPGPAAPPVSLAPRVGTAALPTTKSFLDLCSCQHEGSWFIFSKKPQLEAFTDCRQTHLAVNCSDKFSGCYQNSYCCPAIFLSRYLSWPGPIWTAKGLLPAETSWAHPHNSHYSQQFQQTPLDSAQ